MNAPRLVVAAPASGGGKTTLTLGLLHALRAGGRTVQAFKCGPDYIDPGHHAAVTGRASHNLDPWMLGPDTCRSIFGQYAVDADLSVIEGVMGLFDGRFDPDGLDAAFPPEGSTAHLAQCLDAPILLALDVRSQAASAAATVIGFRDLVPSLRVAGVVLNRVGSERHGRMVRQAIEERTGLPVLGALPRASDVAIPERHLGLHLAEEDCTPYAVAGDLVRAHVDLDRVERIARDAPALTSHADALFPQQCGAPGADAGPDGPRARVAVARDAAFSFAYPVNLDLLAAHGAEVVPFSPLADEPAPDGAGLVYIPGGYPELHAGTLAGNARFRASLTDHAARGGAVLGECGGLMLLGEELVDLEGRRHAMPGLLPLRTHMSKQRLTLGYVDVETVQETLLAPPGTRWRGHEFHYSTVESLGGLAPCWTLRKGGEANATPDGWQAGRVLAGYLHLHFAAVPGLPARLVALARDAAGGEPRS
ncbi:MAG: cobyrinate a,c-diamide synthase [Planctomycetota bacterium]